MAFLAASTASTPGRTVTRNVLAMVTARGVVAAAGLVTLPFAYTHLGADAFGVWAVLNGVVAVVALADLGLPSVIIREVAATADPTPGLDDPASSDRAHRTRLALGVGLVWGVGLALTAAGTIALLWPWLSTLLRFGSNTRAARTSAMWLLTGLLMDGISLPWRGVLEGTQRLDLVARITGCTAILGASSVVAVLWAGGGLVALAMSVAAISVLRGAAMIVTARRHRPALSPTLSGASRDEIRALVGFGMRVQVTSASGAVNVELDRFILAGFFTPAIAGGFDLGSRVVALFRLVAVYVLVALFPMAVTRSAALGREWLDDFNVRATKYLTAFATVAASLLVASADPIVRLWLGEGNRWASSCIIILAPAYALNLAAGTTGILSRVEGRPGRETRYALLSSLLNLVLTWPLLRLLGPRGVPLATAVGIAVGTAYFLISYHRATDRDVRPLIRAIWPSAFAAAVSIGAAMVVGSHLPGWHGRVGAAVAIVARSALVIATSALAYVATGFLRAGDGARLREFFADRSAAAMAPTEARA